jgi:hypothetical protein
VWRVYLRCMLGDWGGNVDVCYAMRYVRVSVSVGVVLVAVSE